MKKSLLLFLTLSSCTQTSKGIGVVIFSGLTSFTICPIIVAVFFYFLSKRERKDFEEYYFRILLWSVLFSTIFFVIMGNAM